MQPLLGLAFNPGCSGWFGSCFSDVPQIILTITSFFDRTFAILFKCELFLVLCFLSSRLFPIYIPIRALTSRLYHQTKYHPFVLSKSKSYKQSFHLSPEHNKWCKPKQSIEAESWKRVHAIYYKFYSERHHGYRSPNWSWILHLQSW